MPKVLASVFLFLFVFLLFFRPLEMNDSWWHLSAGRWIVAHQQVPVTDPFPYINEMIPWLHTHWLGSVLLYLAQQWNGTDGLKFLRAVFFVCVIGIFYFYYLRKISFTLLLFLTVLLSYGLSTRHFLRPEMFNYVFLQLLMILLLSFERTGRYRVLYFFPFLGVLWFNIHFGAVIYGAGLIGLFWLSLLVQWWQLKGSAASHEAVRECRVRSLALGLALAGFVASFLVTPLGWAGLWFQLKIFTGGDPRNFYATLQAIPESMPAQIWAWERGWFWGLFALVVVFLILQPKRRGTRIMLFLAALGLYLAMSRNSGFFVVVSAYIIADAAAGLDREWLQRVFSRKGLLGAMILCLSLFVMGLQLWITGVRKMSDGGDVRRTVLMTVEDPRLVHGVEFLKKYGISGRVFNTTIGVGGYFLWAGYPALRPFMDGRNLDLKRYFEAQAVLAEPQRVWPVFEQKYAPDIIVAHVNRDSRKFFRYIDAAPEWQLVYVEGMLVIYIKRGMFTLPEDVALYQQRHRAVRVSPQAVNILRERYGLARAASLGISFDPPPYSVTDSEAGMTLLSLGYAGAAVEKIVAGTRQEHIAMGQEIYAVFRYLKSKRE